MSRRLLILNPNSSRHMTEAIAQTVAALAGPDFTPDVRRVPASPASLETFYEYEVAAAASLAALREIGLTHDSSGHVQDDAAGGRDNAAGGRDSYAGLLLACFGDPGLWAMKETCRIPVVGMAEAALSTALLLGYRFGLLVALPRAVPMMDSLLRLYGLRERCAGIYPLDLPVLALESSDATKERAIRAGRQARSDGADVLVLGCAGLTGRNRELERELQMPVIDPIASGYLALEAIVRAGLTHSKAGLFGLPGSKLQEE